MAGKVLFRSSTGLTDLLHTVSLAVPIFLILLGSLILFKDLIPNPWWKSLTLAGLLALVALVSPLGSRLKQVEIFEKSFKIESAHGEARVISFEELGSTSVIRLIGIIRMNILPSDQLSSDSVWFIPEVTAVQSRRVVLEEIRGFLDQQRGQGRITAAGNS
ncbi:MAG: hypothetical protein PHX83_05785 [Acidobacteriia bacterium]|nr:hypothetical protein [Terriglobia bacterium]